MTYVPPWTATPTSALFNAGASLTPSPVIPVLYPSSLKHSTIKYLCSGNTYRDDDNYNRDNDDNNDNNNDNSNGDENNNNNNNNNDNKSSENNNDNNGNTEEKYKNRDKIKITTQL